MTRKQEEIQQLLIRAINSFNRHERYLIENNLCERCICSRFAMHIEKALCRSSFNEYVTDVEYDRGMGGNEFGKKRLQGHDVYLDLIVHKREYDGVKGFDNLFAVEMKKQGQDFSEDKERLQILVDNENGFCYRAGFAIVIVADRLADKYELELVEDGKFYNAVDF